MPRCYANNPPSPYGVTLLPKSPNEDTSTYSNWGVTLSGEFWRNPAKGDRSMKFGTNGVQGTLIKINVLATKKIQNGAQNSRWPPS